MRDLVLVFPEWIKLLRYTIRQWFEMARLHRIDRYLASRGETRAPIPVEWESLPVLDEFFTPGPLDYDFPDVVLSE